ncbi:MAG: response regulator transcription factor [Anaerolineae bacterium]|nr:response regulator transcription factor [Anaerolineae bacterium]NUQ06216.1 response regulator transcription factor [Anaerolineae bacterium]
MIRIILADDHQMVLDGLARILADEPEFSILATAKEGLEAVRQVERLKPDILIADLMMPGINGLEVTRQAQRVGTTKVIILSMHADEAYVLEALRSGARGYVLKEDSRTNLIHAIREVMAGRRYLSAPLSERAIETYLNQHESAAADPYESLTAREHEVFQMIAEGHSNKTIADRLSIGVRTVETHRANLMAKLNLRTSAEIIHFAYQRGILK